MATAGVFFKNLMPRNVHQNNVLQMPPAKVEDFLQAIEDKNGEKVQDLLQKYKVEIVEFIKTGKLCFRVDSCWKTILWRMLF